MADQGIEIEKVGMNRAFKSLVICDKDGGLSNFFRYLPAKDYVKMAVEDEKEALEKTKEIKPNTVYLDLSIPKNINKLIVCKEIKGDLATKDVRIIILTESLNKEIATKYLNLGVYVIQTGSSNKHNDQSQINNYHKISGDQDSEVLIKHKKLSSLFNKVERAKMEWEQSLDVIDEIILLADLEGNILRANKKLTKLTGKCFNEILNKNWNDLLRDGGFSKVKEEKDYIEIVHKTGERFHLYTYPLKNSDNVRYGNVILLHNITLLSRIRHKLLEKNKELKKTQSQVIQQEKMASIGQLAAGVAHEINNPVGFVTSNLDTLQTYTNNITKFLEFHSELFEGLSDCPKEDIVLQLKKISQEKSSLKIDFIIEDMDNLVNESLEGTHRVKEIVQSLKNFSHIDDKETFTIANINDGLESTIKIVWNELKYKATLEKNLNELPQTKCNPGQLNQVFMNFLVNSVQAIEEKGKISIKTYHKNNYIYIDISDTGCGIQDEDMGRLFEPFYTTKDVGQGTGLGLSIAYDIIKQHKGDIKVISEVGKGTTFTITIPVNN